MIAFPPPLHDPAYRRRSTSHSLPRNASIANPVPDRPRAALGRVSGQAASPPAAERSLVRAIGTWGLTAGIINVTVGGGVFRVPADAAAALGPAAPVAYLVCALAMGLVVISFAEAGSRVSRTGGPYAYVEAAFGPYAGFLIGALLWLAATTAVAAVSTVFAVNAAQLVSAFEPPLGRALLLGAAFAIVAAVNVVGVEQGSRLVNLVTIAKLLPLALLVIAGVFFIEPANLTVTEPVAAGEVMRASVVLVFVFAGIESALVPSGEVKTPARTVPRAILIAMVAITLLYLALQLVAQGVLGAELATSGTPLADAAGVVLGPWGRTLLLVGVVVSTFGYLSGMTLAVPRALFAFARDGYLPRRLAAVHDRFRTPYAAILLQSAIACALAITSGFARLAIIANVAALLVYLATSAAAWRLRHRNAGPEEAGLRFRGARVVPVLAAALILGLLSSVTLREWFVLAIVVAVASLIFAGARSRARAATPGSVPDGYGSEAGSGPGTMASGVKGSGLT